MTNSDVQAQRQLRTHICTQWLFLRAIGLIYVIAFASLAVQVDGLIGSQGILPAARFLDLMQNYIAPGSRLLSLPTLMWLNSSDTMLHFLCWGGVLAALGVLLSFCTAPLLVLCWVFYLSLVNVGQDFLSFQWDILLLEAGFLAIFWAPWQTLGPPWRSKLLLEPEPKTFTAVLWLCRWLLFRLMFLSGSVKLLSGDTTWRNFTALRFHYETQPLPTPIGWLANQLPAWFQSLSVAGVFFIELIVPFFFFVPGRPRYVAAALTVFLQVLIVLTGNYTFFNWLTLALCLTLLDDQLVTRVFPSWLKRSLIAEAADESQAPSGGIVKMYIRRTAVSAVCALVALASLFQFSETFAGVNSIAVTARRALHFVESFHLVNTYGLFAVMTTSRLEISVEGSDDAVTWIPYTFRFKPGQLDRPPPIVAPYQPRLDWQMWFAALGSIEQSPWFFSFVERLLEGSPSVVQLLADDPFHGKPPRYIHAITYDYHFTTLNELIRTHNWWKRQRTGVFMPAVSLSDLQRQKSALPGAGF